MKSIAVYTEEMDDLEVGVAELLKQIESFELLTSTVGILFAHPDRDFEELMERLLPNVDFPILGSTAISMFTQAKGYTTQGISLQVLTADDVEFHAGITPELNKHNAKDEIQKLYKELAEKQSEKEKIILSYVNRVPGMVGDEVVAVIDEVSDCSPIYGGYASDSFIFDDCRVIYNNEVRVHALSMVLISGNVRPRTIYEYSIRQEAEFSATAHGCTSNSVARLGTRTFVDAMEMIGMHPADEQDAFTETVGMPLMVTYETPYGDEINKMRHMNSIDSAGRGIFIGNIPEGSQIHLCLLNRADIRSSVQNAAKRAFEIVREGRECGYNYSTILVTSCASRIMTFINDLKAESDGYVAVIPANMSMSGMYSFGEFCPTYGDYSGRMYNIFHNTTFTILML